MTPQQIVGAALRITALWFAVNSVRYLLIVPIGLLTAKLGDNAAYSYATGISFLGAAVAFWFFPMSLAHKIVPRTTFENHINIQYLEAARIGCSLVGLWIFANALPSLAWFLFRSFLVSNAPAFQSLGVEEKLSIATSLFEIMFSLVLVLRSSDFARLAVRQQETSRGND